MYLGTRQVGTVKFENFFLAKQSDKIKIVCRVRICIHADRSSQQTQTYFPLSLLISAEFELESRLSRTTCLSCTVSRSWKIQEKTSKTDK